MNWGPGTEGVPWTTSNCGQWSHSQDFFLRNELLHVSAFCNILLINYKLWEKTAAEDNPITGPCVSHLAQQPDVNGSSGLSCYKM